MVEFIPHHLVAQPQKLPNRRKNLGDISYTIQVIADFVSKFIAMATGVIEG